MVLDPFSASSSAVALASTAFSIVKGCNSLIDKYQSAPRTLSHIRTECQVTKAALDLAYWVMESDQEGLTSKLGPGGTLAVDLADILTGCTVTFSKLDNELSELYSVKASDDEYRWNDKLRRVWKEDKMTALLDELRGLRDAVHVAIGALQAASIVEMIALLKRDKPKIDSIRKLTDSTKSNKNSSLVDDTSSVRLSIFDDTIEQEFLFDDEIVNSRVYRNTLKSLSKRSQILKYQGTLSTAPPPSGAVSAKNEAEEPFFNISDIGLALSDFASTSQVVSYARQTNTTAATNVSALGATVSPSLQAPPIVSEPGFRIEWFFRKHRVLQFARSAHEGGWRNPLILKLAVLEDTTLRGQEVVRPFMDGEHPCTRPVPGLECHRFIGKTTIDAAIHVVVGHVLVAKWLIALPYPDPPPGDTILLCVQLPANGSLNFIEQKVAPIRTRNFWNLLIVGLAPRPRPHTPSHKEQHTATATSFHDRVAVAKCTGAIAYMEGFADSASDIEQIMSNFVAYAASLQIASSRQRLELDGV